jgi:glycosyltransferase involved in cell wall biosynthesis
MPAYNEAKLIRGALEGVPGFVDHIIVVDDASVDATAKIARAVERPIKLIEHPSNQGVGSTIATGCRHALLLGADLTAVMAADGQMDPADLPALLAPLIAGEADYVKGNRLGWPEARKAMPWHRWLGNRVFSSLTRQALGVDVHDSQCGYVAMNRRTKEGLDWDRVWKGYGYPNDVLSCLTLGGLRVGEVPVRPVYGSEQSGIRLRHVLFSIPFVIVRAWLRRLYQRPNFGDLAVMSTLSAGK